MPDYADQRPRTTCILPFATLAANRLKDFTKDMEMAAIVYLAESGRKKGESHLLKKPDEKLVFVTEAGYPFWLMPYNNATLLFDGLGIASHILAYDVVPDVEVFARDIHESQKSAEASTAALARSANYFESFAAREEERIDALIAAPDLIEDLTAYFSQMDELRQSFTTSAHLAPVVGSDAVQAGIEQLANLRKRVRQDIENLDAGMKLLNTATGERIKAAREEIRSIQELHDKQIAKIRPQVTREISRIRREHDRGITRTLRESRKRLQRLRQSQVRLQKTLRHLKAEARRCETRIRSGKRSKKQQKQTWWILKLKRIKKSYPTIEKDLKGTAKRIQKLEADQRRDVAELKAECGASVEATNKTLQDLQASRTADVATKRQEIATMEEATSSVTAQMLELTENKKAALEEFDKLTMLGRRQACTLVYVPFYLVRYETEGTRRYVVYPPSIVGDLGTVTRMKGALGVAKMKALLRPRSQALTAFLNQLVTRLERSPMVEKEVTEACIQHSILLTRQLRMDVRKGLKELETEEWISPGELESFSELLYIYV